METGTHGYKVKTFKVQDTEVHVAQLHVGAEYFIPGLFEGSRFANNWTQAEQFAKEDVKTGGEAHAWRETDEGGAGWKHKLKQVAVGGDKDALLKHLGL